MTHEESSEAQAEAVGKMWPSNHMAGRQVRVWGVAGRLALSWCACVTWLHTCDVWSGLCTSEAPVETEGTEGQAACGKCRKALCIPLWLMAGLQRSAHSLPLRLFLSSKYTQCSFSGSRPAFPFLLDESYHPLPRAHH